MQGSSVTHARNARTNCTKTERCPKYLANERREKDELYVPGEMPCLTSAWTFNNEIDEAQVLLSWNRREQICTAQYLDREHENPVA